MLTELIDSFFVGKRLSYIVDCLRKVCINCFVSKNSSFLRLVGALDIFESCEFDEDLLLSSLFF